MAAIRSANTKPELLIRSGLHARGFRYRLHVKGLPGKPDLVFPRYRAVVLVNGCFWHGHLCHMFRWPGSREEFWREKIRGNMERDRLNIQKLKASGWRVAVVWECALKGRGKIVATDVIDIISKWLLIGESQLLIEGRR